MQLQVVVLLLCLAGLALAAPSRSELRTPPSTSARDLDEEQLRETVNLIEKFIPPIFESISEDNDDPTSRLHKLVDSSLLLSREAVKVRDPTESNKELTEEVQGARETMPLILDILRATMSSFKTDNIPDGGFDLSDFGKQ